MCKIDFKSIDRLIKSAKNGKNCAEALRQSGIIKEWMRFYGHCLDEKDLVMLSEKVRKLRKYGMGRFSDEYEYLMSD